MGSVTVDALKGITLSINKNEYVAIMGPSGSGKTTLMNSLGCLDGFTGGEYTLNGREVNELNDLELAHTRNREIGFVFQMFNLLPKLNAIDNVALPLIYTGIGKNERTERARDVLIKVGLGDRMLHKPNELSGGQQQRIAIARALVNNPSIILADEPTGNLDTKTTVGIIELFEEIHDNGNTVIYITHEEQSARHAHRIIRLIDGLLDSDMLNENIVKIKNQNAKE